MPDFSMCSGGECPRKEKCYRYRAIPHMRQSYFVEPPLIDGECNQFMRICGWHKYRLVSMEELALKKDSVDSDTG